MHRSSENEEPDPKDRTVAQTIGHIQTCQDPYMKIERPEDENSPDLVLISPRDEAETVTTDRTEPPDEAKAVTREQTAY